MKKILALSFIIFTVISACNNETNKIPNKNNITENHKNKIIIKIKNNYKLPDLFLNNFYADKTENYKILVAAISKNTGLIFKDTSTPFNSKLIEISQKQNKKFEPLFSYPQSAEFYNLPIFINNFNNCSYLQINLPNYLIIEVENGTDIQILINSISTANFEEVEYAYLQTQGNMDDIYGLTSSYIDPHYLLNSGLTYRTKNQKYLDELKISNLWQYAKPKWYNSPNQVGQNIQIIDIEAGWDLNHKEYLIESPNFRGTNSIEATKISHGTNVLGLIKSNVSLLNLPVYISSNGMSGISPSSDIMLVSVIQNDNINEFWAILVSIIEAMKYNGDSSIILIERWVPDNNGKAMPLEYVRPIFDLIRVATKCLGITVIEAAANGNINFDNLNLDFNFYSREKNGFTDSGAIVVGSTKFMNPPNDGVILDDTYAGNFGSRIDTYLWGENIYTTFVSNNYSVFSHTSAASAITAGIVSSLQWYAKNKWNKKIPPAKMRELLRNNPKAIEPTTIIDYTNHKFQMPNYECLMNKVDRYCNPSSNFITPNNCN